MHSSQRTENDHHDRSHARPWNESQQTKSILKIICGVFFLHKQMKLWTGNKGMPEKSPNVYNKEHTTKLNWVRREITSSIRWWCELKYINKYIHIHHSTFLMQPKWSCSTFPFCAVIHSFFFCSTLLQFLKCALELSQSSLRSWIAAWFWWEGREAGVSYFAIFVTAENIQGVHLKAKETTLQMLSRKGNKSLI